MVTKNELVWRLCAGAAIGFAAVAACAGAAPQDIGQTHETASATPPDAEELAKKAKADAGGGNSPDDAGAPDKDPKCPYGSLEDPHRGFVRCLAPEERDAGWLPPPPQNAPVSDAGATLPPNGAPPIVEAGKPKFDGGEVPKLDKALEKANADMVKCIGDNGGLTGASGSFKVKFLVRPRGRAEGVDVSAVKGVTTAAATCVEKLWKNRAVGEPTADPTGVTVTFNLKPAK